jgi:ABC-type branched-subunit amino acid transport system permease subunit
MIRVVLACLLVALFGVTAGLALAQRRDGYALICALKIVLLIAYVVVRVGAWTSKERNRG